ncbi:MAG: signal peptide peptidase SppA [Bdellovibrionales bacterium]|nr:signal peptide peptidase SppA [Bdellovibrionales bacterium]
MKEYFLWLAKFITVVIVILIAIPMLIGGLIATTHELSSVAEKGKESGVAIVEVKGMIQDDEEILRKLHEQIEDEHVTGIVLDVDSPGGAVGPSQAIYDAVRRLKEIKPIVVSMGTVAASGGLYVSLGASKVLCQPGTMTGSIGVILQIPNVSSITDKVGFEMLTVKSGALKDVGNAFRPVSQADKTFLQSTVEVAHDAFIQAVAEGRGLEVEKVKTFADGRVILGSQAVEYGLADGYGDLYDAAREVYALAGKPLKDDEQPNIFFKEDKYEELKELFGAITSLPQMFQRSTKLMYVMQ